MKVPGIYYECSLKIRAELANNGAVPSYFHSAVQCSTLSDRIDHLMPPSFKVDNFNLRCNHGSSAQKEDLFIFELKATQRLHDLYTCLELKVELVSIYH